VTKSGLLCVLGVLGGEQWPDFLYRKGAKDAKVKDSPLCVLGVLGGEKGCVSIEE
jgi:hypothetical protein